MKALDFVFLTFNTSLRKRMTSFCFLRDRLVFVIAAVEAFEIVHIPVAFGHFFIIRIPETDVSLHVLSSKDKTSTYG